MTVKQTQALLVYLGYDPGDVDGIWGAKTMSAVKSFQTAYGGLTVDGYPGTQTDKAMRHAVCYGMPETTPAAIPAESDSSSSDSSSSEQTADESALKYIQSDGYYHIPKTLNIRLSTNFTSREFRCGIGSPCSSCSETLINPKLVEYLQKIHDYFNSPITITSGYRCTNYNRSVGGATGSRHSMGDAADIVVAGNTPRSVARYAEDMGVQGIGLYETSSDGFFVHIDTRPNKSFWYGQGQAARSTFK